MFETFSIKFHNREAFNTAVSFLQNSDFNKVFNDIGHADMIISFDNKTVLDAFVYDCLFWEKSNLKGAADFTINK